MSLNLMYFYKINGNCLSFSYKKAFPPIISLLHFQLLQLITLGIITTGNNKQITCFYCYFVQECNRISLILEIYAMLANPELDWTCGTVKYVLFFC